jgi:hypothetical protein
LTRGIEPAAAAFPEDIMPDMPNENQGQPSDKLDRAREEHIADAPRPHPSPEETEQEIEEEDRFESTDN